MGTTSHSSGGKPPTNRKVGKPRTLAAPSETVGFESSEGNEEAVSEERSAARLLNAIKLIFGSVLVVGLTGLMFWTVYRYALTTPRFAI